MYIYNTLSRQKEKLVPSQDKDIRMYCCGVTVYDKCHIGHARSLYLFDIITRYLRHRGYNVKFIRNITDVDDKIIKKANEQNKSFDEVVKENIALYEKDLERLGVSRADCEPRATENIDDMIAHIEGLIAKGYAYEVDGDVYFCVRKFKQYGRLSGQSIEKMLEAVRIEPDSHKRDPLDFALWKKAKEGEPFWDSPWGRGRPGWHIECSVMSRKFLKTDTLDIHAGGRDLIFPHHENEIAQAEALTGKQFARYWIHNGLLTINGQKMSKSLGNFITIEEAVERYSADNIKLFFISSHYASDIDFTEDKLNEVEKQRRAFGEFFDKVYSWQKMENQLIETSDKDIAKIDDIVRMFYDAMDDDFNTPAALGGMFKLIDMGSRFISANKKDAFIYIYDKIKIFFDILGLTMPQELDIPDQVKDMIKERQQAKKQKDFVKADAIRERIYQLFGLSVIDTAGGGVVFTRRMGIE